MIIDSIGFSGTHSISYILEKYAKNTYIIHGSKNPFSKEIMGVNDLTEYDFLQGVIELEKKLNKKVIVVHCYYPPDKIIPLCQQFGISYALLLRNPVDQISSCFNYGLLKILKGDTYIFKEISAEFIEKEKLFSKLNIKNNLSNNLYLWAFQRVTTFNLNAFQLGSKIYKMENILNNYDNLNSAFGIEISDEINDHEKSIKLNSHKNIVNDIISKIDDFSFPDEKILLENISCRIRNQTYNISQINQLFGY